MTQESKEAARVLDLRVLVARARARSRVLAVFGPILVIIMMVLWLVRSPRLYSSEAVISIQRPQGGNIKLAGFGQAIDRRYLGILSSRRFAEEVEGEVHLQEMYHLRTHKDALDLLMKSALNVLDDTTTDLVHVGITLPGPPRADLFAGKRVNLVRHTTMDVANAYTRALSRYYAETDNDSDLVLWRTAQTELDKATANFHDASLRLKEYMLRLKGVKYRAVPMSAGDTTAQAAAAAELQQLYLALAQAEAELQGAVDSRNLQRVKVAKQLGNIPALAAEDPLLKEARARLTDAKLAYRDLRVQYGPQAPNVVAMQQKVAIAQEEVNKEAAGVRQLRTTGDQLTETTIAGLQGKRASLLNQIATTERSLNKQLRSSMDFQQLRSELEVQLEALKSTASEAAKLRLDTTSGQSRVLVLDPPLEGEPAGLGFRKAVVLYIGITLGLFLTLIVFESLIETYRVLPATAQQED